jgi:photosystem II stability/assembly factor-like uncharacterized protein
MRGLSMVNERIVWASGTRGSVLRSTDGGRGWTVDTIPGATTLDLRSIHALNDAAAFAASAGEAEKGQAKIFATGDSGRHWNLVYATNEKGIFLDAIAFWDARHGIALSDPVGGSFVVLTTADGGRSWTRVPASRLPRNYPGEAAFAASGSALTIAGTQDVWIGTGGGGVARVMHSADRGQTWAFTDVPIDARGSAAGIFSVAFADPKHGIAVGGDYTQPRLASRSVAISDDGGRSWRAAEAPPAAYLSGVAFAGSTRDVVAVGLAGTFVSRDGGDHWTQADTVPLNAVRFSGRMGIAVGPRGRIGRTDGIE